MTATASTQSRNRTRRLTVTALMGAIAFILMYLELPPIPFLSPFAKFDFSSVPELIGGFMLGPVGAFCIIVIKIVLKLIFKPTTTFFVGELSKFFISCALVLPAAVYYQRNKTRKGALIGMGIGLVTALVVAVVTNLYMIYPMYMKLFNMDWNAIFAVCGKANKFITNLPTLVVFSFLPFNLILFVVTDLVTALLYKKISVPLKKFMA